MSKQAPKVFIGDNVCWYPQGDTSLLPCAGKVVGMCTDEEVIDVLVFPKGGGTVTTKKGGVRWAGSRENVPNSQSMIENGTWDTPENGRKLWADALDQKRMTVLEREERERQLTEQREREQQNQQQEDGSILAQI